MVSDAAVATAVAVAVTASFPFYLRGALLILDADPVTWDVLVTHLKLIAVGLLLTTGPVVGWMVPRLLNRFTGVAVVHALVGLQAYALLVFALTGIVHIFRAKREADLYRNPDRDVALDELHEKMPAWRARLRVGVFGYLVLWVVAWLLGVYQFLVSYVV